MKFKILFFLLFFIFSCDRKKDMSNPNNKLSGKKETLELVYIAWGCACANWITPENFEKHKNDDLDKYCIFIEPENKNLEIDQFLYYDFAKQKIRLTGQFYLEKDYPKGTEETEETLQKARVFRYNKIEILDNFVLDKKNDTIINLTFNNTSCSCAKWSYTKFDSIKEKEYFYLEPENNKLIDAEKIFDGNNLPLQIKIKGQFISDFGFPKGYKQTKGEPERSKVFRYNKIKILKNGR